MRTLPSVHPIPLVIIGVLLFFAIFLRRDGLEPPNYLIIAVVLGGIVFDYANFFIPLVEGYVRPEASNSAGITIGLCALYIWSARVGLNSLISERVTGPLVESLIRQLLFQLCSLGFLLNGFTALVTGFLALLLLSSWGLGLETIWTVAPTVIATFLLYRLPRSFSLGEALLCGMMIVNSVLLSSSVLGVGPFIFVHPSRLARIASAIILGVFTNILTFSLLISGGRRSVNPILLLSTIIVSIMAIGFQAFSNRRALLRELTSVERLGMSIRWLGIVVLTMTVTSLFVHLVQRPTKLQLHLMRKFYHVVAMCIFIPGIMGDISWLRFCLVLASALFITLEALRLLAAGSWTASVLRMGVETFRNRLDSGNTILSHLWLLVGCAMPIWMSGNSNSPITKLSAMSGVLTLGVLDTAAAILGLAFNGPRWPGSDKTIIGSFAGLFAHFMGQLFVTLHYNLSTTSIKWTLLLVQGMICTIWEATSDQNDNLTLPLVAFTASTILLY